MTATLQVPAHWEKAMTRAISEGLKATRRVDGTYRVPSVSAPGTVHTVTLDARGQIASCDCLGWTHGGRQHPCKHAGACAIARAAEQGITLQSSAAVEVAPRPSATQMFRAA